MGYWPEAIAGFLVGFLIGVEIHAWLVRRKEGK